MFVLSPATENVPKKGRTNVFLVLHKRPIWSDRIIWNKILHLSVWFFFSSPIRWNYPWIIHFNYYQRWKCAFSVLFSFIYANQFSSNLNLNFFCMYSRVKWSRKSSILKDYKAFPFVLRCFKIYCKLVFALYSWETNKRTNKNIRKWAQNGILFVEFQLAENGFCSLNRLVGFKLCVHMMINDSYCHTFERLEIITTHFVASFIYFCQVISRQRGNHCLDFVWTHQMKPISLTLSIFILIKTAPKSFASKYFNLRWKWTNCLKFRSCCRSGASTLIRTIFHRLGEYISWKLNKNFWQFWWF